MWGDIYSLYLSLWDNHLKESAKEQRESSSGRFVEAVRSARGSVTVNKRQPEPAGDDSQVTQPSPDPPVGFCGRTAARERWHGEWRKPDTIPILLSRLLLSWGLPSPPPRSTISVPPARHCITDWLTDWPTRWLSLLLLLCFILS